MTKVRKNQVKFYKEPIQPSWHFAEEMYIIQEIGTLRVVTETMLRSYPVDGTELFYKQLTIFEVWRTL